MIIDYKLDIFLGSDAILLNIGNFSKSKYIKKFNLPILMHLIEDKYHIHKLSLQQDNSNPNIK
jgi:hypothetical protein